MKNAPRRVLGSLRPIASPTPSLFPVKSPVRGPRSMREILAEIARSPGGYAGEATRLVAREERR